MMRQRRQREWSLSRVVFAALGLVVIAFTFFLPKESAPADSLPQLLHGQIVESEGKYRFPNSNRTLEVWNDQHGNVRIAVHVRSSVVWCLPLTTIPYRTTPWSYREHQVVLESEREWFAAVDQFDRLWVYYGRWNQPWGELRQLPGGSTHPSAPAVILAGLSILPSGTLANGTQSVMDTGNWVGVPAGFLQRVQTATRFETEQTHLIPAEVPKFTNPQQSEMTRRLGLAG